MKKYTYLLIVLIGLFFHGCATAPPLYDTARELPLKDLCQQYNIHWHWDSINQAVTLNRGDLTARALLGSSIVLVDRRKIKLSRPVKRRRGLILVPSDFKRKVINLFIKEAGYAVTKFNRIVIDSGHGGKDPGAIGVTGLKEKEVVLDIAKMLKTRLEREGFYVNLTRNRDVFISLEDRARHANRFKADLFISVHANASTSQRVSGFEIYYLKELTRTMERDLYRGELYHDLANNFHMEKNNGILNKIVLKMLYAHKQAESGKIAQHLASDMSSSLPMRDRGCKTAGFSVLKNTLTPAVLIEVGFLSNRKEESLLAKVSYRRKIASQIAESIMRYVKKYQ